jgi:tRNA threonylcarbamoyladenosine biosynthesis protein TsaE
MNTDTIATLEMNSLEDLNARAGEFLKITNGHKKFAFYGNMGAGKTTFINELCRQLNVTDLVSSPTFALINEYMTGNGVPVYHFDFYRINTPEEIYDIGFEDYCYQDAYCFIEWPEKAETLLPDDFITVQIRETENGRRVLHIILK